MEARAPDSAINVSFLKVSTPFQSLLLINGSPRLRSLPLRNRRSCGPRVARRKIRKLPVKYYRGGAYNMEIRGCSPAKAGHTRDARLYANDHRAGNGRSTNRHPRIFRRNSLIVCVMKIDRGSGARDDDRVSRRSRETSDFNYPSKIGAKTARLRH